MSPGQIEGSESESPIEGPPEAPDRLEKLYGLIERQSNAIILLTGKVAEVVTKAEALEEHQDQADAAIIEVAKKVGGGGGKGDLLSQILPYLLQPRGPSPLEKVAMNSFMRTMAFTSLTTERLAKKQFGEEYNKMIKEMEADLYGEKGEGSK